MQLVARAPTQWHHFKPQNHHKALSQSRDPRTFPQAGVRTELPVFQVILRGPG